MNRRFIVVGLVFAVAALQHGVDLDAAETPLPAAAPFFKRLSPPGEAPVELRITLVRRGLNDAERRRWTAEYRHAEKVNAGRGPALPNLEKWLNEMIVRDVSTELTIGGTKKLLPQIERFEFQMADGRPDETFDAARVAGRVLVLEYDTGDRLVIYGDPDKPDSKPYRIVRLANDKTPYRHYSRGVIEPSTDGRAAKIRLFVPNPARDGHQPALEAESQLRRRQVGGTAEGRESRASAVRDAAADSLSAA
jgi:hypothetical protein